MKHMREHAIFLFALVILFILLGVVVIGCEETIPEHSHEHNHEHSHEQFHHTHTEGGIYFEGEINEITDAEETDVSAKRHLEIKKSMQTLYEDVVNGHGDKYKNKTFTFRAILIRRDRDKHQAVFWEAINEEQGKILLFVIHFPEDMANVFDRLPADYLTVKTRINRSEILRGQGVVEVYITGILL